MKEGQNYFCGYLRGYLFIEVTFKKERMMQYCYFPVDMDYSGEYYYACSLQKQESLNDQKCCCEGY